MKAGDSGKVLEATFLLEGAAFRSRQNSNPHFRIASSRPLAVARVGVAKALVAR